MGLGQHVTPLSATQLSFGPSRGVSLMAAVLPGKLTKPRDTNPNPRILNHVLNPQ